jgi:hypothetical protein
VEWYHQDAQWTSDDREFSWTIFIKVKRTLTLGQYLGYLPSPDTKPQDIKFFKIAESGWDKEKSMPQLPRFRRQSKADTIWHKGSGPTRS